MNNKSKTTKTKSVEATSIKAGNKSQSKSPPAQDLSELLDGNRFKSVADHIIALREIGIYVQPRCSQEPSRIIHSVQRALKTKMNFEENCIQIIKELMGKQLLKDAAAWVKVYRSKNYYLKELEKTLLEFLYPEHIRFIDGSNPLYGLIWKRKWFTEPLIDPLRLEPHFSQVFCNRFSAAEEAVFKKAFVNYRLSYDIESDDDDLDLSKRDVYKAMENYDFYSELFDTKSRCGKSALQKFEKLIIDSIYSPFSEYCSFDFSTADCHFVISKCEFYGAIAGLRSNGKVDICIFDGVD